MRIPLVVISVGLFVEGIYSGAGREVPALFQFCYGFAFVVGAVEWLRNDCARRKVRPPWDLGLLLYITWPIALPIYILKTRGRQGISQILLFIFVALGASLVGICVGKW